MLDRALKPIIHAFAALAIIAGAFTANGATAAERKDFKVCWSIYVGWMPWGYMKDAGIVKKWAAKYGLTIDVVQINDYVESINQYTAGKFDGCSMTSGGGRRRFDGADRRRLLQRQ